MSLNRFKILKVIENQPGLSNKRRSKVKEGRLGISNRLNRARVKEEVQGITIKENNNKPTSRSWLLKWNWTRINKNQKDLLISITSEVTTPQGPTMAMKMDAITPLLSIMTCKTISASWIQMLTWKSKPVNSSNKAVPKWFFLWI
jgi:hypothetical protein